MAQADRIYCDICCKREAKVFKSKMLLCKPCSENETDELSYQEVFYKPMKTLTPREPEVLFRRGNKSSKTCPRCHSRLHVMCG